jgi:hypothetical protein
MSYEKLSERVARLEALVSRLLTALCAAFGLILVFIFYDKQSFVLHEDLTTQLVRAVITVGLSFLVGWPIVRWVVGKGTRSTQL